MAQMVCITRSSQRLEQRDAGTLSDARERVMNSTAETNLRGVMKFPAITSRSTRAAVFIDDVYGYDKLLDEALKRGYPYSTA